MSGATKKASPMERRYHGNSGEEVKLLTNHVKANLRNINGFFCHYEVDVSYEDGGQTVKGQGSRRRALDCVYRTKEEELGGKDFAYDGGKSLFTFGELPSSEMKLTVEDIPPDKISGPYGKTYYRQKFKHQKSWKKYTVAVKFVKNVPVKPLAVTLFDQDSKESQEVLRVLDIILRHSAAGQGCLLLPQSYIFDTGSNSTDIGGCVSGCHVLSSSFRPTQCGLTVNIDVSSTTIIQPVSILTFLQAIQNCDHHAIDWTEAKQVLENLRITITTTNTDYKITGLSEKTCRDEKFELKNNTVNESGEETSTQARTPKEISVYQYFARQNVSLRYSGELPCINVGKPTRPTYFPMELCKLAPLQRYKKPLTTLQRDSLLKRMQTPKERLKMLTDALGIHKYGDQPLLKASSITVTKTFTEVLGRVLSAPQLTVGDKVNITPENGQYSFDDKKLWKPVPIQEWAVVNFSAKRDLPGLITKIINWGGLKGMKISQPCVILQETKRDGDLPPDNRVKTMYESLDSKCGKTLNFILCVLPEKNSLLYGPWKKMSLVDRGVPTQCIAPFGVVSNLYLTNLILKINSKLGGLNSMLSDEYIAGSITDAEILMHPLWRRVPTIIFGMDVSHSSPGQSKFPSIAAVVGSTEWPQISKYQASVRTQTPNSELIESLFEKTTDAAGIVKDSGILSELLKDFKDNYKGLPEQIIIFRDGVSETQFDQVLNDELNQIIEACKVVDGIWKPKFLLIVAQKKHKTRFFLPKENDNVDVENVKAGTVVDNTVCHPLRNDFYLCAQAGVTGTTRPIHYTVLLDEIGLSSDDLQQFVHSLSYVCQRSTHATSIVAPILYAHLAAKQLRHLISPMPDTTPNQAGTSSSVTVPAMPELHVNISKSMYFV